MVALAYLWLPLVSLGAWYLGLQFAYDLALRSSGPESLVSLLISFGFILLGTTVVVILWSRIQRARFARHERRVFSPALESAEEQAHWALSAEDFHRIRSGKRLVIHLDDNGALTRVDG